MIEVEVSAPAWTVAIASCPLGWTRSLFSDSDNDIDSGIAPRPMAEMVNGPSCRVCTTARLVAGQDYARATGTPDCTAMAAGARTTPQTINA